MSTFYMQNQDGIYLLIYNTQVVYQFLDPCFRRDDRQGRNRLKKHVIPAPYQVRDKLQRESSIANKFIRALL
jgi:hypothetical protein